MPRPLALVTGATRGVGLATAHALSVTHDLLLGGRDAPALAEESGRLTGSRPWPVDLTAVTADDVVGIERLHVLVHSAGVAHLGTVAECSPEDWRASFEVNVVAVAELTRLLLPALRAAGGHVVLVNSGAGITAKPGWGPYAASKFALRALGDTLRGEEPGLRVTSVHPGRIDTDMQRGVITHEGGTYDPSAYLRPESVAAAIASAVRAPADAHPTELVLRPAGG